MGPGQRAYVILDVHDASTAGVVCTALRALVVALLAVLQAAGLWRDED